MISRVLKEERVNIVIDTVLKEESVELIVFSLAMKGIHGEQLLVMRMMSAFWRDLVSHKMVTTPARRQPRSLMFVVIVSVTCQPVGALCPSY